MRNFLVLAALLTSAAATGSRVVRNRSWLFEEPKFWARHGAELTPGTPVTVLKEQGSWLKVQLSRGPVGYVPRSTFQDLAPVAIDTQVQVGRGATAAQAANASRGFTREVNAADVSQAGLAQSDHWVDKYEGVGDPRGEALAGQLATGMPAFLRDGRLEEESR